MVTAQRSSCSGTSGGGGGGGGIGSGSNGEQAMNPLVAKLLRGETLPQPQRNTRVSSHNRREPIFIINLRWTWTESWTVPRVRNTTVSRSRYSPIVFWHKFMHNLFRFVWPILDASWQAGSCWSRSLARFENGLTKLLLQKPFRPSSTISSITALGPRPNWSRSSFRRMRRRTIKCSQFLCST